MWYQRVRFLAVLVRNVIWISAILVSNRVCVLRSSLDLGISFRRGHFLIIIYKAINKSLFNGQDLVRVFNFWSGHKWGEGLKFSREYPRCIPVAMEIALTSEFSFIFE